MRFTRRPRSPYTVTDRKRAAAVRSQRREREATPLLATLIAEQQPDINTVMQTRVERWDQIEQTWRDQRAAAWRGARTCIAALPEEARRAVLHYWNTQRWLPGDPSYLLDCLHRLDTSRLVVMNGTLQPVRITISTIEASDIQSARKPIAVGWLGRKA